jgi:hypothetical protein
MPIQNNPTDSVNPDFAAPAPPTANPAPVNKRDEKRKDRPRAEKKQ